MIPVDKYRPKNIKTYEEYLKYVADLPACKLKFGDEKSIKGSELWSRKARPDPFTGRSDGQPVPSDFRNTYCAMGLCTVDPGVSPFLYTIGKENTDSASFFAFILNAVGVGWLHRGDFLVLDNAQLHSGGCANIMQEYLWYYESPFDGLPLNIFVVPFPTRSPELNPIELLWGILVRRLKVLPLDMQLYRGEGLMHASCEIMNNFTRTDVVKCFNKQGYYCK